MAGHGNEPQTTDRENNQASRVLTSMFRSPTVALIAVITLSFAAPAHTQPFQQFGIRDAGFVFEVPPDFRLAERAADGQSATFEGPDGALLEVWSAGPSDLNSVAEKQISEGERDGWRFTYRRLTPKWASFSGVKEGRIRYFRAIAACGDRVALFLLDYSQVKKLAMTLWSSEWCARWRFDDC